MIQEPWDIILLSQSIRMMIGGYGKSGIEDVIYFRTPFGFIYEF